MDSPEMRRLGDAYLDRLRWADDGTCVTLEFTTFPDRQRIDLEIGQVIHIVFARTLEEENVEEPPYWVGEVGFDELKDGGAEILTRLNYGFRKASEDKEAAAYPGTTLYHLHAEGAIVLDIVCTKAALRVARADQKA